METTTETIINEPFVGSDKDPYMYRAVAPLKPPPSFSQSILILFPLRSTYYEKITPFLSIECEKQQCLERGYPIGSGVIEGACRNLINDRLELTGMRWTVQGAESIIRLRAVYINKEWKDFWRFRRKSEKSVFMESISNMKKNSSMMNWQRQLDL